MLRWGLMLLGSKLFYCLQLPINPMLGGGDQNAMLGVNAIFSGSPSIQYKGKVTKMLCLGVIKVLGVDPASQQTFLLSPAPHPSNTRGR